MSVVAGSKVVPQPPEEENLSLHLIAGTPPRSGQSSPDFVIDVGDSINVDADELSDRVRVRNAPSLTLSPTSPGPAESPLVGSPDPAGLLGSHVMQDDSQASRKVAIGGASVEAWGSLEKDGSPRRESEGGKKSRKKKSKDKDKAKSKESKESSAVEGGMVAWLESVLDVTHMHMTCGGKARMQCWRCSGSLLTLCRCSMQNMRQVGCFDSQNFTGMGRVRMSLQK